MWNFQKINMGTLFGKRSTNYGRQRSFMEVEQGFYQCRRLNKCTDVTNFRKGERSGLFKLIFNFGESACQVLIMQWWMNQFFYGTTIESYSSQVKDTCYGSKTSSIIFCSGKKLGLNTYYGRNLRLMSNFKTLSTEWLRTVGERQIYVLFKGHLRALLFHPAF